MIRLSWVRVAAAVPGGLRANTCPDYAVGPFITYMSAGQRFASIDRVSVYKTAALPAELHRRVVPSMLADPPPVCANRSLTCCFFAAGQRHIETGAAGGTRLALANSGQPWPGYRKCVSGMVPGSVV